MPTSHPVLQTFWQKFVRFDHWIEQYRGVAIFLSLVVILRIPTFFEPYWYGDEGIYLTIGNALNQGKILYAEIIDHKTPLIYLFAQTGNQLSFRVLTLIWMVATTGFFIGMARKLITNRFAQAMAILFFIAITNTPPFEGTIPNGELFVMGFVLAGAFLILQTKFWSAVSKDNPVVVPSKSDRSLLIAAGCLFGLGILTKVPAILDLGAWLALAGMVVLPLIQAQHKNRFQLLRTWLEYIGLIGMGTSIPIVISILYFIAIGAGDAYLDFGLLYNFRYAGSWQPDFPFAWVKPFFSLPVKTLLLALITCILLLSKKKVSHTTIVLSIWFWCALFASLLSNRPYPHYFLQIAPPLALLTGNFISVFLSTFDRHTLASKMRTIAITVLSLGTLAAIVVLLDVRPYPTLSYYKNWWQLITNQQSLAQYRQSFNPLMDDNYAASQLFGSAGSKRLFIWGTNPMLYALSKTIPPGRFTVSFHIKDFNAYSETLSDLEREPPPFIVVMHDEAENFPDFRNFLKRNYRMYRQLNSFTIWRKNVQ
ncbi:hypothetical protein KBC79_03270 [Candidatus Woesebacteria bacterium]|nr:hypothetical protein [Candidatus Woesebacteria bacterium]